MTKAGFFGAAAAVAALVLVVMPAQAAGDTAPQCRQGLVWDASQNKCVEPAPSATESETIYQQGRELAEAGRYGEAITVLSRLAGGGDPRVLNYLGFAHRMEGRVIVGLGYYREALRIDPKHRGAHEYIGEAYLLAGDLAGAEKHLAALRNICLLPCEELADLVGDDLYDAAFSLYYFIGFISIRSFYDRNESKAWIAIGNVYLRPAVSEINVQLQAPTVA